MAPKSGKESEKGPGKDGGKAADAAKSDSESKAKEVPAKPVDPVTAFLNGKLQNLF